MLWHVVNGLAAPQTAERLGNFVPVEPVDRTAHFVVLADLDVSKTRLALNSQMILLPQLSGVLGCVLP